jgi:hypothetical protein
MKAVLAAGFRGREEYHEMLVMQLRFDRLVAPLRSLLADGRAPARAREGSVWPGSAAEVRPPTLGVERKGRDGVPAGTRVRQGVRGTRARLCPSGKLGGASAEDRARLGPGGTRMRRGAGRNLGETGRRWNPDATKRRREPGRDLGFYTL